MSFFKSFFREGKTAESVILIDISANSIGGAYAFYREGEVPALLYTRRVPIEIRDGEAHERAMLRTLKALGDDLLREGAPVLARTSGSGSADLILVSVDAPWQETSVRVEHFEQRDPFIFTKNLVAEGLRKTAVDTSDKLLADESIIGTVLNGYKTRNPYGKKVHRATVVVLTSRIDQSIASGIIATLRGVYHTNRILPIAGSSLRYQAMRAMFPHEGDAIILDASSGSLIFVALVRRGIFVTMAQVSSPIDGSEWVPAVMNELTEIAKRYPLPRTIFLLARESEVVSLQHLLDAANFGSLWLSDNPPKIVPVLGSHVVGSVRQASTESPDIVLLLMALYYRYRTQDELV